MRNSHQSIPDEIPPEHIKPIIDNAEKSEEEVKWISEEDLIDSPKEDNNPNTQSHITPTPPSEKDIVK